ncbi:PilZ domain-containing protein [Candidatus Omnitrophota bacterium]
MEESRERRKFPRFMCPKEKFCTISSKGDESFLGNVKNLSREGISITSANRLAESKDITMNINFAEIERQIPVTLRVIWSLSGNILHTYGAAFSSISSEDKFDLLESFYEDWKAKESKKRNIHAQEDQKTWVS